MKKINNIYYLVFIFFSLSLGWNALGEDAKLENAVVYKSPTCGCCSKWEKHLEDNGFKVESHPTQDMASLKSKYHVPKAVRSCHTALIDGYVIEGHVPADDIKELIKKHPTNVVGLSVPGMPVGPPGMESDDGKKDEYDVVTFDSKGKTAVFSHHSN